MLFPCLVKLLASLTVQGEINRNKTISRLSYTTILQEAVQDPDIISESIPENVEIEKEFYKELGKFAPRKTIFTTNSSTTLPSKFVKEIGMVPIPISSR